VPYETNISAQSVATGKKTWFFETDVNKTGSPGHKPPAGEREEALDRLSGSADASGI